MRLARLKTALHPWLDPLLSMPDHWRAQRALLHLPDGEYRAAVSVPYYAQYVSPERIRDYIHSGYDGREDPSWRDFGSDNPADYAFWAPRICALACLKMAAEAFDPSRQPTLWQLVQEGLAAQGYTVRDGRGHWVDQGWYYHAQVHLAEQYGLYAVGRSYVSALTVCRYLRDGWLVAASVTPDIGERDPHGQRYGGHVVLVHGFGWQRGGPAVYYLHNPSGRYSELQANATLAAKRFHASFAHRLIALRRAT
jgi:hypothetical protein